MARRISLREFQQALVRRLNDAAAEDAPAARLGVQIGAEHWLIPLEEAGEVVPLPVVAPVPLTQPWFKGLANIRGNLFSVVDMAAFQGDEPVTASADTRLLLVADRYHMSAALMVNRMLGLRNTQQLERQNAKADRPWESGRFVDRDGRIWRELSMTELVYHNDFLQSGV